MIGRGALGVWIDVPPPLREDFNAWYRHEHLPERLAVPGFLRGRRWQRAGDAGMLYFTLYETQDPDVFGCPAYLQRLDHPTEWTRRALTMMQPMMRRVYRRVAASAPDAATSWLATVRIKPDSGRGPHVRTWMARAGVDEIPAVRGVACLGLYEADSGAAITTEEQRIVGDAAVPAPPYLALCGLTSPDVAADVAEFWRAWGVKLAAEATVHIYRLMYGLAWFAP